MSTPSTPTPPWLTAFSRHVQSFVSRNDQASSSIEVPCTLFHGTGPAPISISGYLERIFKYTHCSPVCFVAAGIYLHRLGTRFTALEPTSLNIHRLLITSMVIAIKFFDDKYYSNGFYSKVGGVSRSELNMLELEFLTLMQFNAFVSANDVQEYLNAVVASDAEGGNGGGGGGVRAGVVGVTSGGGTAVSSPVTGSVSHPITPVDHLRPSSLIPSRPSSGMGSDGGSEESSHTTHLATAIPSSRLLPPSTPSSCIELTHAVLGLHCGAEWNSWASLQAATDAASAVAAQGGVAPMRYPLAVSGVEGYVSESGVLTLTATSGGGSGGSASGGGMSCGPHYSLAAGGQSTNNLQIIH